MKDISVNGAIMNEMYDYKTLTTFGTYMIPGMGFDLDTNSGPKLYNETMTAQQAAEQMQQRNVATKLYWSQKLDGWLKRFHPQSI